MALERQNHPVAGSKLWPMFTWSILVLRSADSPIETISVVITAHNEHQYMELFGARDPEWNWGIGIATGIIPTYPFLGDYELTHNGDTYQPAIFSCDGIVSDIFTDCQIWLWELILGELLCFLGLGWKGWSLIWGCILW